MTTSAQQTAIYCRLSYSPDGSIEKVERQEVDCRELAERLGWQIEKVYSDNSRSAWQRNRKRPAWDRMLADIEAGRLDAIVVWHGDRLIRQPWDLETLLRLADERHLRLAAPSGTRDLGNEDHRFILRIEAAQACKSSADTSRRVRRGWQARAASGHAVGGGKRPFGYGTPTGRTGRTGNPVYDTTKLIPEEADVLREAIERMLTGQSQASVVRWMSTVSTTSQGYRWTSKSLRNLLLSPRIAGLIRHDDKLYEAAWPAIVTHEQWEDLQSLLRRNAKEHPYPGRERKYQGSGVYECPSGHTVRAKPSGGRNRKTSRLYYCPNPDCEHKVGRNVEHLDEYVTGRVLRRLNEPGFLDGIHRDAEQPGVGAEIAALERRKAQVTATLEELADHPDVDPALLARSLASFDRKITRLRNQLAATNRQRLLARMAGITREQWDAEPVDVRAATIRALYQVTILPTARRGPGFDPKGVRLQRRRPPRARPAATDRATARSRR